MTIQFSSYGSSTASGQASTKSQSWSPVGSDQSNPWPAIQISEDGDYLVEFSVGRPYIQVSSSNTRTGYFSVFKNGDTSTAIAEGNMSAASGHSPKMSCSARGQASLNANDQLAVYWYTSGGELTIDLDSGTNLLTTTPIDSD